MRELQPPEMVDGRSGWQRWRDGDGPRARPGYVYVASSWRNLYQPGIVAALRTAGLEVYDFRNPSPGSGGFNWRDVDPAWQSWEPVDWRRALRHRVAQEGFRLDRAALARADCVVLVLPSGRSVHLEAGWHAGRGGTALTLALEPVEPDLMNLLLGRPEDLCVSMDELFDALAVDN